MDKIMQGIQSRFGNEPQGALNQVQQTAQENISNEIGYPGEAENSANALGIYINAFYLAEAFKRIDALLLEIKTLKGEAPGMAPAAPVVPETPVAPAPGSPPMV